jgi:hypothetical protein
VAAVRGGLPGPHPQPVSGYLIAGTLAVLALAAVVYLDRMP